MTNPSPPSRRQLLRARGELTSGPSTPGPLAPASRPPQGPRTKVDGPRAPAGRTRYVANSASRERRHARSSRDVTVPANNGRSTGRPATDSDVLVPSACPSGCWRRAASRTVPGHARRSSGRRRVSSVYDCASSFQCAGGRAPARSAAAVHLSFPTRGPTPQRSLAASALAQGALARTGHGHVLMQPDHRDRQQPHCNVMIRRVRVNCSESFS
jgi:hypothetical protein